MIQAWEDQVTVVLHYRPEAEDLEGGYEAETIAGVPHGIIVSGSDRDSARAALNHLIDGLTAFGFTGRLLVEDATVEGLDRYEAQVVE